MREYLNMWKNIVDFRGRATVSDYWMATLINAIISAVLGLLVMYESSEMYESYFSILSSLYSLAVFLPGISMTVRRLNDIGEDWKYIFVSLIPVVGVVLLIIKLVKKSENNYNVAKAYDPDKWICESCGTRNHKSAMTCKDCGVPRSKKAAARLSAPQYNTVTALSVQNVWICRNCGTQITDGGKFCKECGTPRPQPSVPYNPNVWVCRNCGTQITDGGRFCKECGSPR